MATKRNNHITPKSDMKRPKPRRKSWARFASVAWWIIVSVLALATVASAYGGMVDPEITTIFALMAMALPILLILSGVAILISLFTNRWAAAVTALSLLVSIGPILDYCPLNFNTPQPTTEEVKERGFTLMSYNVMNLMDYNDTYPADGTNRTLSYILQQDPDIACLLECEYMKPYLKANVTQAQVDSIKERYYYHKIDVYGNSIFSKYPVDDLTPPLSEKSKGGGMAGYKVNIKGRDFALIIVHLSSLMLTTDDKDLYNGLTRLKGVKRYKQVKHSLLHKVSVAMRRRASMIDDLCEYIDSLGMDNVIVTGDFNDIPDCYSIRQLERIGFKSVYSEVGFGPMITYWANRFYFRIDHTLYRGALTPVAMTRGDLQTSDHYPLMTEFLLTPTK